MEFLNADFWKEKYDTGNTGWDVGRVSSPLKSYFDQLTDRNIRVLVPGGGNSYEAEYLFNAGFRNVFLLDLVEPPLQNFKKRVPSFPASHLIHQNFFDHEGQYDLIIEQTFFCALNPELRPAYAKKIFGLLKPGGKLAGLLFDDLMTERDHPPFGGTKEEYQNYFSPYFNFKVFTRANNSIEKRKDRELFMILLRKEKAEPI
ncbi:MAG: methyltransferase domain-containing protein [Chitinophagales bacterium]